MFNGEACRDDVPPVHWPARWRRLNIRRRSVLAGQTRTDNCRLRDEAPQAYKDLRTVMQAQHSLVRTERTLLPILNDKRP
jgi:hypothetical protein